MDNRKNFRRIVLLIIFILIVVSSLMISRMAGNHTQKPEDENGAEYEETMAAGAQGENDLTGEGQLEGQDEAEPEAEGSEDEAEDISAGYDEAVEAARRKREEDERYVEYRRKLARESQKKAEEKKRSEECAPAEEEEEEQEEEEPYVPPTILIVSDLHYMSGMTHDAGDAFISLMLEDDGKLIHCSDMILEALIDEAISRGVSAVVMAGDNTYNGERVNHEELARRLKRLKDAGIAVLLVPGNHDINDTNAAYYFGDEVVEAEYLLSADEYYEIYGDFYEGANSRDPFSLSYVYPLDATHWIMLLDSAWYEDRMHVDGRIRPETLLWMESVFEAAEEVDAKIVPVAHHNLLSESRVYTKECVMTNYDEVLELLESHNVPLYLSGHLHAQRIKKHKIQPGISEDEYGITEIVSSPISIAPCQYGILSWDDEDAMHYEVFSLVDHMDADGRHIYADMIESEVSETDGETEVSEAVVISEEAENGSEEADIGIDDSEIAIDVPEIGTDIFEIITSDSETDIDEAWISMDVSDEQGQDETFAPAAIAFTKAVISSQIASKFPSLPEDIRQALGDAYADMYYLYVSGSYIDWDAFTRSGDYALWQKYAQPTRDTDYIQEMRAMSQDNTADYHTWDHP